MPNVKMRVSAPGSPDGIRVLDYEAGETYDVPVELARVFTTSFDDQPPLADALEELPEAEGGAGVSAEREEASHAGAAAPVGSEVDDDAPEGETVKDSEDDQEEADAPEAEPKAKRKPRNKAKARAPRNKQA